MQSSQQLLKNYFCALTKTTLYKLRVFIAFMFLGTSLFIPGQNAIAEKLTIEQKISINSANQNDYPSNLYVENLDGGWVILHWTAPGDDGNSGQASTYDLRFQDSNLGPIDTDQEWQSATQVIGEPDPSPAGQMNYIVVSGLEPRASYYFCIKTLDEYDNCSDFSNSPLISIEDNYDVFLPGDANGDGNLLGSDVTYLVLYFRGVNPPPNPFFAGDANGDCLVIGSDVTRLVGYFRGNALPPVDGDCEQSIVAVNE
ncbi:MAG: fibronectin type III domain-containing protein [candidate division Zixibacteria bacterium]|nr:fibronectin type III domain-containing protein [candidate division Zixibacteria bacterium]